MGLFDCSCDSKSLSKKGVKAMKEMIFMVINLFLVIIDGITGTIMLLCGYALRVWRNNLRNFVFNFIRYIDDVSFRLKNYLEEIGVVLRYRMQYESVTRPMKAYYREIKNKR